MLKKLRRKFIAIAMLSVSIVLIAIVGTINIANYIMNEAIQCALCRLPENGRNFSRIFRAEEHGSGSNKNDENTNTGTESTNTGTETQNTFGNTADESITKGPHALKSHHPAE